MLVAENFNLRESLLFLLSMRETLCLLIDESNISYRKSLKTFIINEASDYQIISLIIDGELPLNESYFNELVLFERIRLDIKENKNLICEMFGVDIFDDITKKIGSVGSKTSTKNSLLEAMSNKEFFAKALRDGDRKVQPSKYKMDPKMRKFLDSGKKASDKYHDSFDLKPKYDVSPPSITDKVKSLPKGIPKPKSVIPKSTPAPKGNQLVQTKKAVGLRANIDKAFDTLKDKASSGVNAATSFVKAHPAEISGVLLAVLAIYVSTKIYKRFYSKAAKSCSTYKGSKKTVCMKKFQISGYKAQLTDLKKATTRCGLTKNPEKCVKTINKKMDKINKKISKAV